MIRYALSLVWRRKLRTILTSLGITISVILLSLIIFGMNDLQRLITSAFQEQFNPNEIFVSNSAAINVIIPPEEGEEAESSKEETELTLIDDGIVEEVSQISGVQAVGPIKNVSGFDAEIEGFTGLVSPTIGSAWDIQVDDPYFSAFWGRVAIPGESEAVVSTRYAEVYKVEPMDLLGEELVLKPSTTGFGAGPNRTSLDKEYRFQIVGVADPGRDRNDFVLSVQDGVGLLADFGEFESRDEYIEEIGYDILRIQAIEGQVEQVKQRLESEYSFGAIFTADDILSFFDSILGAFRLVLVLFGVVSAVVAAIGIMNTMVMSIYEQTKEIGIIKAMGASRLQILIVFLIQSGVIGLLGGVSGLGVVVLGMRLSDPIIVDILIENGFTVESFFTFDATIISWIILASIVVGVLAGLYPALKAASLNPVDALRSD